MGKYFALRIRMGKLDYDEVAEKYPQYRAEIDKELTAEIEEGLS